MSELDLVRILADNLRLRGSVLPMRKRRATGWARELDLPRGGETVLYTGLMYQLVPHVERLGAFHERLVKLAPLARRVNRVVNGAAFLPPPPHGDYERVPANVARLLRRAGVEFGYLYEDDLYAGALAWDLGAEDEARAHAQKVAAAFRRHDVREAITIDPHTTSMLRSVYPELVEGWDVRVRSYLEVLAERGLPVAERLDGEVVFHDSCVYARYEQVVEEPRTLLAAAGLTVSEPEHARALTWCCGGPAESLYPEKAAAVAAERVGQLAAVAPDCVTACPICLANLRKAANGNLRLRDISDVLVEAAGN